MKAQEEHEGLVAVRDRLESGRVFVEEQLAKTKVCVHFSCAFIPATAVLVGACRPVFGTGKTFTLRGLVHVGVAIYQY